MKPLFIIFAIVVLSWLLVACPESVDGNPFGDGGLVKGNDIANYRTVRIGDQTWMAENLDYAVEGSRCYNNQNSYCDTYGRLYNWATAMTVCPNGWHLPSDDEWDALENYVGNSAGKHLKATSGWYDNGNGLNTYRFSALPGGFGNSGGGFDEVGYYGLWWGSTEYDSNNACSRYMIYDIEHVYGTYDDKNYMFSVRCIQD